MSTPKLTVEGRGYRVDFAEAALRAAGAWVRYWTTAKIVGVALAAVGALVVIVVVGVAIGAVLNPASIHR